MDANLFSSNLIPPDTDISCSEHKGDYKAVKTIIDENCQYNSISFMIDFTGCMSARGTAAKGNIRLHWHLGPGEGGTPYLRVIVICR